MVGRTCERCGITFSAKRRSSRFCSDGCRSEQGRQRVDATHALPEIQANPRAVLRRLIKKLGLPNPKRPSGLEWTRIDVVTWMLKKGRSYATDASPTEKPMWHAIWSARHGPNGKRDTIKVGPSVLEAYGLKPGLPHAKMMAETLLTGNIEEPVLAVHNDDDCTEKMERDVKTFSWLLGKRRP